MTTKQMMLEIYKALPQSEKTVDLVKKLALISLEYSRQFGCCEDHKNMDEAKQYIEEYGTRND